mmetsp:Transcript_20560/g.44936  ORF Transcript_20560/g.44936 Transcript_20560/m.44936 type:complete len:1516 (-) Transcript_20560:96-4643(-)|eukprot:CAMPEP_0170613908 /NCGR_PEP_ID=MMETSP0224-20130122/24519_1 /TAXON_ID=285029 /ORGANISM="Togula jolla, Strain CCCM 725" /LENGTH=1515 /DNA_ID=CAMNT_0010939533 /DNA_START=9 /DNA_END=4556 /DNA_ORIENTATION=+
MTLPSRLHRALELLVLLRIPAIAYAECRGFEEVWGNCPDLPTCNGCKPVDCKFGDWGEWYDAGGCTQLDLRERQIVVTNNECGRPCDGPKIESKQHARPECILPSQDCLFGKWTKWSACVDGDTGKQKFRTRVLEQMPTHGGKSCTGQSKETEPCTEGPEPVDCSFTAWQEWTSCSATCGPGRHTRLRRVAQEASHEGRVCQGTTLQSAECTVEACPVRDCEFTEWTEWVMNCPQMYRHRRIKESALSSGKPCNDNLQETKPCEVEEPKDCLVSDWSAWSKCDKTCDGGQTKRVRTLKSGPSSGGSCDHMDLYELKPCNEVACDLHKQDCMLSEWSDWGGCSVKCGEGSKERERTVLREADEGRAGCGGVLKEIQGCTEQACNRIDCEWGEWTDWGGCSCTCGGGTKRRSRTVLHAPRENGKLCEPLSKNEIAGCNQHTCDRGCIDGKWSLWGDWSECSATCDSGMKVRRRTIAQHPNACGIPVEGQTEEYSACSDLGTCEPNVDCQMGEWSPWSPCSGTCFGISERNRLISQQYSGNGKPCNDRVKEIRPCNPGVGEDVKPACGVVKPVDCVLSQWTPWGACSRTCGGGQMEKTRKVITEPKFGGQMCEGDLALVEPCQENPCKKQVIEDCQWNDWSDWSDCTPCGGQRYRHRSIIQMPNKLGELCKSGSIKEVGNCTSLCGADHFCAWSEWSDPSGCPTGCGRSSEMRSRTLGLVSESDMPLLMTHSDHQCAGSQLTLSDCKKDSCTPECVPEDCVFAAWSEWSGETCIGLCERSRGFASMNNECGKPCEGALTETKKCETTCNSPVDCELGQWAQWSLCQDRNAQKTRSRGVLVYPEKGGKTCKGALSETTSCLKHKVTSCKLSEWDEWTHCTASCGGSGTQRRMRTIVEHAEGGGEPCKDPLEELQSCADTPCPVVKVDCIYQKWSEWSVCKDDRQRFKSRGITQYPEGTGKPCEGALEVTETCGVEQVDCDVSDWTEWDTCRKDCGGGQVMRHRKVHAYPVNGGKACPSDLTETKGCNTQPCDYQDCVFSPWNPWAPCSTTCGLGATTRIRTVLLNRNAGGEGCDGALVESKVCEQEKMCEDIQDCAWAEWSPWSDCSCSCSGGQKTRSRSIAKAPRGGGKACEAKDKEEIVPCNTAPCKEPGSEDGEWGEWTAWSPCTASCGGGLSHRKRKIAKMATGSGKPVQGNDYETKSCNELVECQKSVDCEFSTWYEWSGCSQTCNGVKRRTRDIATQGRSKGKFCEGALEETFPCNLAEGEFASKACAEAEKVVDCGLSDWSSWEECPVTCGGGMTQRTRVEAVKSRNMGKACAGSLVQIRECGRGACTKAVPIDCKFGDWQDWGACDKCGGQRKRFRSMINEAENGGINCDPLGHEETSNCTRACHQKTWCTWGSWVNWGQCSVSCGLGTRARRRYLTESDKPAPEPLSPEELLGKYETLSSQLESLESGSPHELVLAFGCGFACILLGMVAIRALRSTRQSAPQNFIRLDPSERFADDGPSRSEVELPLIA